MILTSYRQLNITFELIITLTNIYLKVLSGLDLASYINLDKYIRRPM